MGGKPICTIISVWDEVRLYINVRAAYKACDSSVNFELLWMKCRDWQYDILHKQEGTGSWVSENLTVGFKVHKDFVWLN